METTLYGDLPEDFWGEAPAADEDVRRADDSNEVSTEQHRSGRGRDSDGDRPDSGHDEPSVRAGAVPLFTPTAGGARLPVPIGARGQGAEPAAPEGERFEQLQALFPGRIIEVTYRVDEAVGEIAAAGDDGGAAAAGYGGSDDLTGAAGNESVDEPRYDTAAEAAAEEQP